MFGLIYQFKRLRIAEVEKEVIQTHTKKLKRLKGNSVNPSQIRLNDGWLVNTTDRTIPDNVKRILQLGPKFVLKTKKTPLKDIVANAEYILRRSKIPEDKKGEARLNIISHLKTGRKKPCVRNDVEKQLEDDLRSTKQFLKENEELLVLCADNGNNKSDYYNKLTVHLEDKKNYKKICHDPTNKIINSKKK